MDQIYEDIEKINKKLKCLNCKAGATAAVLNPYSALGNVAALSLENPLGTYYNMASPHTGYTGPLSGFNSVSGYTVTNLILGGFAQILINLSQEPNVAGATKIAGSSFAQNVPIYLIVNYNGNRAEYFFLEI